ncbi:hypothetical protein TRFO_11285 [Tritrichomonas foetus]|uniref:Transcription initiation factor IIE subunit alpha N-terminal domain-containing protein n=1 Tax=Tritrichomonas foetus TaxID=1144522 RepID=A0A1J4J4C4_9EUKA|nr:hypothetical protein TRFO_11285 [Tritrichomonas foetus]|eukprot:OHS94210.1 hypothetical protein TRFO_11285 [Tritrichomonas foetus]
MSNILEQLVQEVAYMFYDREKTMVLIGLLELGRQVNLDELSNILKFRKNDLSKVLGALKQDRLIGIEPIEDTTGVDDVDSLTQAQRKKLIKDYYSLDFKSFVDSINLKIRIARERLKVKCGPEDNIFYQCPQCTKRIHIRELISFGDIDNGLLCPECQVPLTELDDSDELNQKTKAYNDFVEKTQPLLKLINQLSGLVMINDSEDRCKSDSMIPEQEYKETKHKIEKELQQRKYIGKSSSNYTKIANNAKTEDIHVQIQETNKTTQDAKALEDIKKQLEITEKQEVKQEEKAPEVKRTINIYGKEYTVEEINDEITDKINENGDEELLDRVLAFMEG